MDNHQRRKRHSHFWIKFSLSLGCFCLFYFFLIRPIQTIIVAEVLVPALQSFSSDNSDFLIQSKQDDYLIESHSNKFIDLKINPPFNGYFWLAVIFIWTFGNKTMMKVVIYYNLALIIIIPIFIFIILSGNTWVAPLINANEIVYKALFLSLSVLVIKEGIKKPGNPETMIR